MTVWPRLMILRVRGTLIAMRSERGSGDELCHCPHIFKRDKDGNYLKDDGGRYLMPDEWPPDICEIDEKPCRMFDEHIRVKNT